jgi:hypothetical protein
MPLDECVLIAKNYHEVTHSGASARECNNSSIGSGAAAHAPKEKEVSVETNILVSPADACSLLKSVPDEPLVQPVSVATGGGVDDDNSASEQVLQYTNNAPQEKQVCVKRNVSLYPACAYRLSGSLRHMS